MASLSVCMMVQNMAKTLPITLESLNKVYDDLILVDGGSNDETCNIGLNYGARIIHSPWPGNHSDQRNVYLKAVNTDWIFILDGDEFIDIKTLNFLESLRSNNYSSLTDNYWLNRKWICPFDQEFFITSKPHFPDWQRRLFCQKSDIYYQGKIHEILYGLEYEGEILEDLSIYHLDLFITNNQEREQKVLKYSSIEKEAGLPNFYLPNIEYMDILSYDYDDLLPEVQGLINQLPIINVWE